MAKVSVNDVVAVMRKHPVTDTPYMVMSGTLVAADTGLPTTDLRAKGEEGEVTGEVAPVAAPGWGLIKDAEGRTYSFNMRDMHIFSQKYVKKHEETMALIPVITARRAQEDADAQVVAGLLTDMNAGLDVDSLSTKNLLVIGKLLGLRD